MRAKKVLKYLMLIIIYIIINIIFGNGVEAVSQTITEDINGIDNEKYPGVKQMIQMLQYQYPNWKFKVLYTGLTFDEVITNEYVGHKGEPRSLVSVGHTGEWICPICEETKYDSYKWYCASETALKYMVDPRNSINSSDVFQFMELTYTDCDYDTIQQMVAGTFLDKDSYINTIIRVAQEYNISAYYIVALAIQEQGVDGGSTVSGNYPGYEGYYNIFNIGANGNGGPDVVTTNGLIYAKSKEWDSIEKSIEGGMTQIVNRYIKKGQNTLYFQKFDVEDSDGNLYWHQYQQNILAAQNEGVQIRKTFEKMEAMDSSYTFIIPLYENTPATICKQPNAQVHNNDTITSDLVKINASELRIRNLPNGPTTVDWLYQDEIVTRLNKATEKVEGTYWDYIMKSDGTRGYVARETYEGSNPYKLYLVPVEINNTDEPSGGEEEPEKDPEKDPEVSIIQSDKIKIDMINKKIITISGVTLQDVIDLSGVNMTAKTATGDNITNESKLATGYTIDDTYTVSVLGDVNGDTKVDTADLLAIQKQLLKISYIEGNEKIMAADLNKDSKIDTADLLAIQKKLLKIAEIQL